MSQQLPTLPIGIQNFPDMINQGYIYVDKTYLIDQLISSGKAYFLSRPRRFGKSLLLSTLESIFKGQKALFQGLAIDKADYDWTAHPVLRIDMSEMSTETTQTLILSLRQKLLATLQSYGCQLEDDQLPLTTLFKLTIEALSGINRVVVLIDEYDKPLINHIDDPLTAKANRDLLRNFYAVLKAQDANLRFVLLTGVTKFSKISVFSGLNNLNDISFDQRYATLLGYTQHELEYYFAQRIEDLAKHLCLPLSDLLIKIKHWYNGYCFCHDTETVYNPFSSLLLFDKQRFSNYWFETGTPSFLVKLIKQKGFPIEQIETMPVGEDAFSAYEVEQLDTLPLLYQTGYLTIKDYDMDTRLTQLGYPNVEVGQSFMQSLLNEYGYIEKGIANSYLVKLVSAIKANDLPTFFDTLKLFFANIPYDLHIASERYYQSIFYFVFRLLGIQVQTEVHTNKGRIDAVIELDDRVYIFEFKLDGTAQQALAQIQANGYAEKYANKQCILIGVNFDQGQRNVGEWLSA